MSGRATASARDAVEARPRRRRCGGSARAGPARGHGARESRRFARSSGSARPVNNPAPLRRKSQAEAPPHEPGREPADLGLGSRGSRSSRRLATRAHDPDHLVAERDLVQGLQHRRAARRPALEHEFRRRRGRCRVIAWPPPAVAPLSRCAERVPVGVPRGPRRRCDTTRSTSVPASRNGRTARSVSARRTARPCTCMSLGGLLGGGTRCRDEPGGRVPDRRLDSHVFAARVPEVARVQVEPAAAAGPVPRARSDPPPGSTPRPAASRSGRRSTVIPPSRSRAPVSPVNQKLYSPRQSGVVLRRKHDAPGPRSRRQESAHRRCPARGRDDDRSGHKDADRGGRQGRGSCRGHDAPIAIPPTTRGPTLLCPVGLSRVRRGKTTPHLTTLVCRRDGNRIRSRRPGGVRQGAQLGSSCRTCAPNSC